MITLVLLEQPAYALLLFSFHTVHSLVTQQETKIIHKKQQAIFHLHVLLLTIQSTCTEAVLV